MNLSSLIIPSWYMHVNKEKGGGFVNEHAYAIHSLGGSVGILFGDFSYHNSVYTTYEIRQERPFPILLGNSFSPPKIGRIGISWLRCNYLKLFEYYVNEYKMPDVLHVHSWPAGLGAIAIADKYGIPWVLTEHLSSVFLNKLNLRQEKLAKLVYSKANKLIAVSPGLAKALQKYTDRHITVVPNIVDTSYFYPIESYKTSRMQKVLISIGDPWFTKGYDLLVEALALLFGKGIECELWLGDEIPNRKHLERRIKTLGMTRYVRFLGRLDREEVRKSLWNSDVYISASRFETFGIALAEAIACGVPVVASATAGSKAILEGSGFGRLVPVGAVKELASSIEHALKEDRYSNAFKQHVYAEKHFGEQKVGHTLIGIYEEVIK